MNSILTNAFLMAPARVFAIIGNDLAFGHPKHAFDQAHIDYLFWLREQRLDLLGEACTYMEHNTQAIDYIWRWFTANIPGNQPSSRPVTFPPLDGLWFRLHPGYPLPQRWLWAGPAVHQ
jgi:hypothetical protein